MMKKVFLAAIAAFTLTTANAQQAFKSLGIGVEAGLMGFGIQASMPVVNDHLLVSLGYNFYGIHGKPHFDLDKKEINKLIDKVNDKITNDKASHPDHNYYAMNPLAQDASIGAEATLGSNFKIMAEYYPSKNSSFHIKAGLMINNGNFLSVSAAADDATQELYRVALLNHNLLRKYGEIGPNEDLVASNMIYTLDNEDTYCFTENTQELAAKARIKTYKVKPYIGFGFGRAIPRKRVGVQFEIGAWYHGTPTYELDANDISDTDKVTTSKNPIDKSVNVYKVSYDKTVDSTDGDINKILKYFPVWPQLTIRLTGRIL